MIFIKHQRCIKVDDSDFKKKLDYFLFDKYKQSFKSNVEYRYNFEQNFEDLPRKLTDISFTLKTCRRIFSNY